MAQEGISEAELERVRSQILAQRWSDNLYYGMQSPLGRALSLAYCALFEGDPGEVNTMLQRLMRITPEQVREAVGRYLATSRNRTVMTILPGASQGGAA